MKKYNKLFLTREFRAILGGKWYGNLLILIAVFLLTIGSLSFSRAGLEFLKLKMEDPFVNWVNIQEEPQILEKFYDALTDNDVLKDTIKSKFAIHSVEKSNFCVLFVADSTNKNTKRIIGRTLEYSSDLWSKILAESNIKYNIKRGDTISENDFGWVVTADYMKKLGYGENNIPLFLKLEYLEQNPFVPIPIIAVVDKLPDDKDFVAPSYFYAQHGSQEHPFDLSDSTKYGANRIYFVVNNGNEDKAIEQIKNKFSSIDYHDEIYTYPDDYTFAFDDAKLLDMIIYDTVASKANINKLCDEMEKSKTPIYRYYDYQFGNGFLPDPTYISIMFDNLSKVKDFQIWASNENGQWSSDKNDQIRIDIAQIEAKENFHDFENLAVFLCGAIILISISFVGIFLYFLINAHFQKISKNLGTIMAFGLDNGSIIRIYLFAFMKLILRGLAVTTILLFAIQYAMQFWEFVRTAGGVTVPYLKMTINRNEINDWYTWLVFAVIGGIITLSAIVTYLVMRHKLKATPGDLIFERNN